jgi:glycosyltransferase involved in cell wall biosynthesis
MRISIVSSFFLPVPPVSGGAMEKIWFRFAREFAGAGHEVTFLSRTWPGFPDREVVSGIRMIRVPGFDHTRRLWRNLALDLVWGLRVAGRLPQADIVACNTVTLPAWLPSVAPRKGRVVAVLGRMPKGHARFYGGVSRVVATSEAVRERVLVENPRLAGRTRVFPNPIDWELHRAASRQAASHGPLTLAYVGRIHPEKGIEVLLEAAALMAAMPGLPEWRLRLVGPSGVAEGGGGDAYLSSLRALAGNAGRRIAFEGPVFDPAELARVYGTADVFCYPSLADRGEGLSVAPIEAMAAGAVPVVSALDCYRDVIADGVNGSVFDHRGAGRAERLAGRLSELLADPGRRSRMAARAVEDSRRFDYGVVAAGLLGDFSGLISK